MSGDYLAPPDHIKSQGLPNEPNRGVEFASFLDQHPKFDPKLMGGRMNANGTFAPLGDRASDREWIAIKQAEDFKLYVTEELDSGQPLHLKGGKRIPHRPKGQNRPLVDHHWAEIDLGQYDMYEILAEAHLKSISNYKIWKRTSKAGEIRWIYRSWANPKVQKNVHFWTIHGEVDPPWEMATYQDLWAEYQPDSWKRDASMRLASALSVHE